MAIKHYGLDAAEIEALESQGKTDDEINDLNNQRVKEQIGEEDDDESPESIDFKHIKSLMPGVHDAIIGYILTSPSWDGLRRKDDGYIKEAYQKIEKKGGVAHLNDLMKEIFMNIDNDEELPWEFYDFSDDNLSRLLDEANSYIDKCTNEDDKMADYIMKNFGALQMAKNVLGDIID